MIGRCLSTNFADILPPTVDKAAEAGTRLACRVKVWVSHWQAPPFNQRKTQRPEPHEEALIGFPPQKGKEQEQPIAE